MERKTNLKLFITDEDPDDREFLIDALITKGKEIDFSKFENGALLFEHRLTQNKYLT